MPSDELKVLTDSIERIMGMKFPFIDDYQIGREEWERQRDLTLSAMREAVLKLSPAATRTAGGKP